MARAVWSGTISFGLVNIPVKLYNATAPRDVRFHQFDRETGKRVRHQRVAGWPETHATQDTDSGSTTIEDSSGRAPRRPDASTGQAEPPLEPQPGQAGARSVAYEDIVKGYELAPDRFVMVTPEELRALQPEPSRSIDIEDFVGLEEIDPVYFDKSYYIAPQRGVGAEKPYSLLLAAMGRAGKVGIARFVLKSKPYLAAIRPMDDVLVLETLFFADEVRELKEIGGLPVQAEVPERELDMAKSLIGLMATNWDPSRYRDEQREQIMDLIREKAETEGGIAVAGEEPEVPSRIPDLLAALKASVEAAKQNAAEA
jgi:DNA end-binding protein Ku